MQPLDVLFLKILDDIANTRPISPLDREELRISLIDVDKARFSVGSWLSGSGNINVNTMQAKSGDFQIAPIEAISMYYGTASTSIPNDTETALVQSGWEVEYGRSKLFKTSGDKILVTYPSRVVCVFGAGNWAESSTGRRSLTLKAYDNADNFVTGATLYSIKGSGLVGVPDVYSGISWLTSNTGIAYYKLFAYQNSGGALDLEYYELALFALT